MKRTFLSLLTAAVLASPVFAQSEGMTINLSGDSGTEQAAKLELIRILNERMNKLTVSQLNARVIVSRGVTGYYKVEEINKMHKAMWGLRSNYVVIADRLEKSNPGFSSHQGNGFSTRYIVDLNNALETANLVKKQLETVTTSGKPILLPAMPSFNISLASQGDGAGDAFTATMNALMAEYGITSEQDLANLPADKQAEFKEKAKAAAEALSKAINEQMKAGNNKALATVGNIIGTAFGVPGAGTAIMGVVNGKGVAALSSLVGSIVDNFQIPVEYYDSNTLKLTDAERIKMIDELHLRISEAYQQTIALGANMSNETKTRYQELAQPRNEQILYGPKK